MLRKRCFDLCLVLVLLVCFLPAMGVVAVWVRLRLGGPVIFRQQRPGLHGCPFYVYKFRTMTDARDPTGHLLPDEERLTPTGALLRRLSLDELPQLFNVLRGDMSFVGPRPLLMEYLPLYNARQHRRHEARPGITGWAQVNGRNAISWEEKFELDVWYVDNQSLGLDLRILWLTVLRVAKRDGVNAKEHVTMPKFAGTPGEPS